MTNPGANTPPQNAIEIQAVSFRDIIGWDDDDHAAAYRAFYLSCERLISRNAAPGHANGNPAVDAPRLALLPSAHAAVKIGPDLTQFQADAFFKSHFQPHRLGQNTSPGLVTGYFEPELNGSRTRCPKFQIPVHKRPNDLVNLVAESERGTTGQSATHARKTENGLEPYFTRQQIDNGALDRKNLELVFLADPVDKFFMQVQGSGLVKLDDGTTVRLTYDGKNGLPYTSIGRYLIERGEIAREDMTLESLGQWLKADKHRGRQAMWQNQSYVFFSELTSTEADAPMGVDNTPLMPGRSLAVDTSFHALGTPIYVEVPTLNDFAPGDNSGSLQTGFRHLMIAQDVGSAITGPQRGDIFFGTGKAAGERAGTTNHQATFTILLPRNDGQAPHAERP